MRKLTGLLLLGGALLSGALAMARNIEKEECDLKTVEDGLYCEECDEILDADSITKGEYCADCYEEAVDNGDTPAKAKKVKVCVKTYYVCPDCYDESRNPGTCAECKVKLEKEVDKALVVYKCQECGMEYEKEGLCTEKECAEKKAKVVRTCSESGEFPHVK